MVPVMVVVVVIVVLYTIMRASVLCVRSSKILPRRESQVIV